MDNTEEIIKDFLDSKEALFRNGLKAGSGLRATHRYARIMDRFIRTLFLEAGLRDKLRDSHNHEMAVIALGSYGRRELCISSDVDLMVIHKGRLII